MICRGYKISSDKYAMLQGKAVPTPAFAIDQHDTIKQFRKEALRLLRQCRWISIAALLLSAAALAVAMAAN